MPDGLGAVPDVDSYGAQLKVAICLIKGGQELLSQHLGDLGNALTWEDFLKEVANYAALFEHQQQVVARNVLDDFATSKHARGKRLPVVAMQQHQAYLAA